MDEQLPETAHVMRSYITHPKVAFEGQSEQEKIILLLRAHPLTQVPWILNSIFLFFIVIVLNFFLPIFLSPQQIIFFNVFMLVVILSYIWFNFLSWYFNVGLITNQRIVDIDFNSILYKEVTATRLDKIEDVTSKSGGYFKSLFNYGNVFIQTAGTEVNIEFMNVPFPSRVVEVINRIMQD